jgi:hypothetical protein
LDASRHYEIGVNVYLHICLHKLDTRMVFQSCARVWNDIPSNVSWEILFRKGDTGNDTFWGECVSNFDEIFCSRDLVFLLAHKNR